MTHNILNQFDLVDTHQSTSCPNRKYIEDLDAMSFECECATFLFLRDLLIFDQSMSAVPAYLELVSVILDWLDVTFAAVPVAIYSSQIWQ